MSAPDIERMTLSAAELTEVAGWLDETQMVSVDLPADLADLVKERRRGYASEREEDPE